jgi:hypothetical protein
MNPASNVLQFPVVPRLPPQQTNTHPVVKAVTEIITSLGTLAKQVETWPIDKDDKLQVMAEIRSAALTACELQLSAVGEVEAPEKFKADVERVMRLLRDAEV